MSTAARPPFRRDAEAGLVAGVAAGLAAHLGVDPLWVRVAFGLLATLGGAGVVAYGAFWVLVPLADATGRHSRGDRSQLLLVAALVVGILLLMRPFGAVPGGPAALAFVVAAVGLGLVWRQADVSQRHRWVGAADRAGMARLLVGVALVLGGVITFLAVSADVDSLTGTLLAAALAASGLVLAFAPWWRRVVADLGEERAERIRSEERAELAAHLHDSVLQTLALIQRNADSPAQVQRLARSQERELRSWLWGEHRSGGQLGAAVRAAAAEVEDRHGVAVQVVAVGDMPMDERSEALVRAAREAMVNAAKFAGVEEVDVFVEVEPDAATVFVRDTGVGFDPTAVPPDRRGIAESIVGRMARHGGSAVVRSEPGDGTEIELRVPREVPS